jgi:LuxR family transcriptional regulator, maltose regulon positive regulatory protein
VVETLVAALEDHAIGSEPGPPRPNADVAEPLTERELEVLGLIAAGASNQEIARRLVVSLPTLKTHVNHVFAKLEAESRVQVVMRARKLGLLASLLARVEIENQPAPPTRG